MRLLKRGCKDRDNFSNTKVLGMLIYNASINSIYMNLESDSK